ncbi:MAG: LamG-like jellyroll fold domain-containing protein, partial [bacterium]
GYDGANLTVCENLYGQSNAVTAPTFTYNHAATVVPGETCPTGTSSISGLAFYDSGAYPTKYDGALFFSDYSRKCIWAMLNPPGSTTNTVPALVAAYGFNEGSGTTVGDVSGNGHTGTVSGATWDTAGRYGGALAFDGTNDLVTVADSNRLDLGGGMTLSAWVFPTALSGWRTVTLKEQSGGLVYSLYAHDNAPRPATTVNTGGGDLSAIGGSALALNAWTHLAATYDGSTLTLYINGSGVGSQPVGGLLATSAFPLRIGGNSVWGEYFAGKIDEVRIYNRALDAGEVQADLNSSTPLSVTSPTTPTTLETFAAGAANPVELKTGLGGDLFYADFDGGAIRRVQYTGAANNQ